MVTALNLDVFLCMYVNTLAIEIAPDGISLRPSTVEQSLKYLLFYYLDQECQTCYSECVKKCLESSTCVSFMCVEGDDQCHLSDCSAVGNTNPAASCYIMADYEYEVPGK